MSAPTLEVVPRPRTGVVHRLASVLAALAASLLLLFLFAPLA